MSKAIIMIFILALNVLCKDKELIISSGKNIHNLGISLGNLTGPVLSYRFFISNINGIIAEIGAFPLKNSYQINACVNGLLKVPKHNNLVLSGYYGLHWHYYEYDDGYQGKNNIDLTGYYKKQYLYARIGLGFDYVMDDYILNLSAGPNLRFDLINGKDNSTEASVNIAIYRWF